MLKRLIGELSAAEEANNAITKKIRELEGNIQTEQETTKQNEARAKELQKELNNSKLNTAWCKHVYKVYEKSEKCGKPSMKKRVDFVSRVLFHITGKRICSF